MLRGSDKGLCPLDSRDEGSSVNVKLDPPFPFWVGYLYHGTPVYNASIAASRFPHMHVSAEVGCHIRTTDLLLGRRTR